MAGLFERMGLVRTEYEGMPEIPMQPVSEPMYAPETPVIDATQVSYDVLGDLDELRRDSATDKLLGSVRDGAEDLRKEVDGAIVVHASRTTTKMSMAEKNAAKAQSDAYLQSLATKYNGKPAIQAPRSGVTFDAPKSKVKEERK